MPYRSDLDQRSCLAGRARARARGCPLLGVQGRSAAGRRPCGAGDGQRRARLGLRARGRPAERGRRAAGADAGRPRGEHLLRVRPFSGHGVRARLALCTPFGPLHLGTPNAGLADGGGPGGPCADAAGAAEDADRHRDRGHGAGAGAERLRAAVDRHAGEPVRGDAFPPCRMGGGRRAGCDRRDTHPVAVAGGGAPRPDARRRGGDGKPLLAGRRRRPAPHRTGAGRPAAVAGVAAVTGK